MGSEVGDAHLPVVDLGQRPRASRTLVAMSLITLYPLVLLVVAPVLFGEDFTLVSASHI